LLEHLLGGHVGATGGGEDLDDHPAGRRDALADGAELGDRHRLAIDGLLHRDRSTLRGSKPSGSSSRFAAISSRSPRISAVGPSPTITPSLSTSERGHSSSAYGRSWVTISSVMSSDRRMSASS